MSAELRPMPADRLDEWRAERERAGQPLPTDGDLETLTLTLDGVEVGGVVVQHDRQAGRPRASVRVLQTTLPDQADAEWAAVAGVLEAHARSRGAAVLVTAVPPGLAGPFRAAGFKATMTTVSKRLDPDTAPELQEDRRVSVRPMQPEERRRFAEEVMTFLRAGMERSGVLAGAGADLGELEARVARLADDPPPSDELLMTGLVAGTPVGRAWATLVTADDGGLDFLGNTIDLFPEHRGQGLTRSFLGALRRHVRTLGVRDVHLRVYAHDAGARQTFLDNGAGVDDVHLRKDLG